MKLDNIINLYKEMRAAGETRQQFDFAYNSVSSDVFFIIDETPYILLFGIRESNIYFEIKLKSGFYIDDTLDKYTYNLLLKAFNIQYNADHKFQPSDFFAYFNRNIPQHLKDTKKITPQNLIKYKNKVEEADKQYFYGFLDNNKKGNKVSPENLVKTRELMGFEAYKRCKKENLSTRWTTKKNKDKYETWRELSAD